MKRTLAVILAIALLASLTACAAPQAAQAPATQAPAQTQAATQAPAAEPAKEDPTPLKLWHIYGGTDPNAERLNNIIAEAEALYNVKIEVDTAEAEAYKTKLKAAVAANEAPDIFLTWGRGFLQPFVEAGKVLKLDDYMSDEIRANMVDGSLTDFSYNGGAYAFTDANAVAVLFCNKELFDQNGLTIPTNWDELVAVVKAFSAKKIPAFAVGAKDAWTLAMYHDVIMLRCVGPDRLVQAMKDQSFSDPGFLEGATKLKELIDLKAFPDGAIALSRDEGEVGFMQGQIPMMMQGSWTAARVYKDTSKVAGKIVPVCFPVIDESVCGINDMTGGGQTAFAVNAGTADPAKAVAVAEYVAQNLATSKFQIGGGISPYKNTPKETTNELFLQTYTLSQNATSLSIWWDTQLQGDDTAHYLDSLQKLFMGKLTPEQYIAELNKMANN